MARTDRLVATCLEGLRLLFTNPDSPPYGGVTGQPQLRAGDGIPPLDNFDECTLLWLNITQRYRSTRFPEQAVANAHCGTGVVVQVQIGVARCSEALDYVGGLPSPDTMAAEFYAQEDDADRLDRVLCVAAKQARDADLIHDWAPMSTDVVGPEGGTVAVVATAAFHLV